MSIAYCWASGLIEFDAGELPPAGALLIVRSDETVEWLRAEVAAKARHAYHGQGLLVPGVPEADGMISAHRAFRRWRDWAFPGAPDALLSARHDDDRRGLFDTGA